MTRLLATLLILVLGAPAAVSARAFLPGNIDMLGHGCCSKADKDAKREQARIQKACCCTPSPMAEDYQTTAELLPPDDLEPCTAIQAGLFVQQTLFARAEPRHRDAAARAPPPNLSLLAQHTSLVI